MNVRFLTPVDGRNWTRAAASKVTTLGPAPGRALHPVCLVRVKSLSKWVVHATSALPLKPTEPRTSRQVSRCHKRKSGLIRSPCRPVTTEFGMFRPSAEAVFEGADRNADLYDPVCVCRFDARADNALRSRRQVWVGGASRAAILSYDVSIAISGRILATNTVSCCMQSFRSMSGVPAFERIKFRTCERAVFFPRRDVDLP
jgi:hypothetical protein